MPSKQEIFRRGSTTYYFSSIFFPPEVREKVFTFYAYVRTADDYVDAIPQDADGFYRFKKMSLDALEGKSVQDIIIRDFIALAKEEEIKKEWIVSFLSAMEQDLNIKTYETFQDLEKYMYGSAEVIGMGMARILGLPEESFHTAGLQGKAMQLINFIRDIKEDLSFGRVYLPKEDFKKFKIERIDEQVDPVRFSEFIRFETERYLDIQKAAKTGYSYIPRRYRIPVQTASSMYNWTARQIAKNPMIVFEKKIKPHPLRVMSTVMKYSLFA